MRLRTVLWVGVFVALFPAGALLPAIASAAAVEWTVTGTADGAVIAVDIADPTFAWEAPWDRLTVEGAGRTARPGAPELPLAHKLVVLPEGITLTVRDVRVRSVETANLRIAPWSRPPTRDRSGPFVRTADEAVYGADALWPDRWVEVGETATIAGTRAAPLTIHLARHNPVRETLLTAMRVEVEVAFMPDPTRSPRALPARRSVARRAAAGFLLPIADKDGPVDPWLPSDGTYLILCHDAFCDAAAPLAEWKAEKGLPVDVVPVSTVGATTGAIKDYLADRYLTEEGGLDYVLLVGDIEHIPTFYGIGGTLADHDYATVDGDDYFADFIIGRMSGQTAEEIAVQVAKSVAYEKNPPADVPWFTGAVAISGSDFVDDENADYCAQAAEDHGFDKVDRFFDSAGTNTKENLEASLAEGRSWISYFGHGWELGWSSVSPSYATTDVLGLENDGMLPAISSIACSNGAFDYDYDSFAEAWMKTGENKGAAAVFAAARLTPFFYTDSLGKAMAHGFFQDAMDTFGAAAFYGKMGMYEEYPEPAGGETQEVMQHFHVFGDPELNVWSAAPSTLDDAVIEALDRGGLSVVVSASGVHVAGALVHLFNDMVNVAGRTDATGRVEFTDVAPLESPADVVVTARNHMPWFGEYAPSDLDDDDDVTDDDLDADDDVGDDDSEQKPNDDDEASDSDPNGDEDSNENESGCGC